MSRAAPAHRLTIGPLAAIALTLAAGLKWH
jgi:hypothetical protein